MIYFFKNIGANLNSNMIIMKENYKIDRMLLSYTGVENYSKETISSIISKYIYPITTHFQLLIYRSSHGSTGFIPLFKRI